MEKQFSRDETAAPLAELSTGSFIVLRSDDGEEILCMVWGGVRYDGELFLVLSKVEKYTYPIVAHYNYAENAIENVDDEELENFILRNYLGATEGTLN